MARARGQGRRHSVLRLIWPQQAGVAHLVVVRNDVRVVVPGRPQTLRLFAGRLELGKQPVVHSVVVDGAAKLRHQHNVPDAVRPAECCGPAGADHQPKGGRGVRRLEGGGVPLLGGGPLLVAAPLARALLLRQAKAASVSVYWHTVRHNETTASVEGEGSRGLHRRYLRHVWLLLRQLLLLLRLRLRSRLLLLLGVLRLLLLLLLLLLVLVLLLLLLLLQRLLPLLLLLLPLLLLLLPLPLPLLPRHHSRCPHVDGT